MSEVPITAELFLLLFATGLAAGFVDSVAGGGGLIALPVLFSIGLPPQMALGTNKLQGSFGTLSASYNFIRKKQVDVKDALEGVCYTLVGAAAGTWIVQRIDPGFLRHLVPGMLLVVFVYTLLSRDLGRRDVAARMNRHLFYPLFGLTLGFYDGFFGPGTGSFWMAAFCALLGFNMTRSAGYTRVMNFTSNIFSLAVFILGGNVWFAAGLCMAAGQFIGARLGSNLAILRGAGFIRPVFLAVVAATIFRLIYITYLA